jgi:Mn2+/Fe2+ NRAMP family transporter
MTKPTVVIQRYSDAYRVASAIVGLGTAIKVVGFILAGLVFFVSLSARSSNPFDTGGGLGLTGMAGILFAIVIAVAGWVCGVVVTAQGQILRATLDTAVSSSHFLNDRDRAEAMGIPAAVAEGHAVSV